MDNKTLATILYLAAAAALVLYMMRRKGRKSRNFKL